MLVEGRNPVREALRAGVRVRSVTVARGAGEKGALAEILELAERCGARVERVERRVLDERAPGDAHQGVLAEVSMPQRPWQDAVEDAQRQGLTPLVLALDGVTDPQNTGALIRSAHVLGAHAVLIPGRRASPVTAAVVKASAGAVFHIPVDEVGNLERALASCKREGLWIAALDADADVEVSNCPVLGEPLALVVGSEGKGVSHLVREKADVLVKIAQTGRIDSLNASVAGAIALYAAARVRSGSMPGSLMSDSENPAGGPGYK